MPPIKMRCPRCGCRLAVPESKAGKRGKCPTCGGPIRVPTVEEAQLVHAHHGPPPWTISLGVVAGFAVLFVLAVLLFQSGGDGSGGLTVGPRTGTTVPDDGTPLEDQLRRILGIEANLHSYQALLKREQFLHVRAINGKLYSYERLAPEELRLRDTTMEDWQKDPRTARDLALAYTPLSEIEKGRYRQILEDLRKESNKIMRAMRSAGAEIQLSSDPFGKNLLDLDEAREKLVDLRTQFQEESSSSG